MAILSMTGYGRTEGETPSGEYRIELRSVNNRYLDIQLRNSRFLSSIEAKLTEYLSKKIARGSVTLSISSSRKEGADVIAVDSESVKAYTTAIKELKKSSGLKGDIEVKDLLQFSDSFLRKESVRYDEKTLWKHVKPFLDKAIEEFMVTKKKEADYIVKDLKKILKSILKDLKVIEKRAPIRLKKQKEAVLKRINALAKEVVDPARIAMEASIIADKLDISEEITRLSAHIEKMGEDLNSNDPVGKKLGFLLQEMNREANTIGSKANDIEISHTAVSLKESIEKIREQVLNLE